MRNDDALTDGLPESAPFSAMRRRRAELVGVLAETFLERLLAAPRGSRQKPAAIPTIPSIPTEGGARG